MKFKNIIWVLLPALLVGGSFFLLFPRDSRVHGKERSLSALREVRAGSLQKRAKLSDRQAKRKAQKADLVWGAPSGSFFRYQFHLRFQFGFLEKNKTEPSDWAPMEIQGKLFWIVQDRSPDEILTLLRFDSLRLFSMGKEVQDPLRLEAARAETFLRMNTKGKVLGLAFAPKLHGSQRDFLRSLYGYLSIPVPDPNHLQWKESCGDATGMFEASFKRLSQSKKGLQVQRTLVRYLRMVAPVAEIPEHRYQGRVVGFLDSSLAWLREVKIAEELQMHIPEGTGATVLKTQGTILLEKHESLPLSSLKRFQDFDAKAWASPGGDGETGELSAQERLDMLAEEFRGVSLQELMDGLKAALRQGFESKEVYEAWSRLGRFLEAFPKRAKELESLLLGGGAEGQFAQLLEVALGAAGTKEAQEVLTVLGANPNLGMELREGAIRSLMQLAQPQRETLAFLRNLIQEGGRKGVLRAASLLSLGTLAGRSGMRFKDGSTPLKALMGQEDQARSGGFLQTWIAALGNTGKKEVVQVLDRYAKNPNRSLREAAIRSLGTLGNDAAVHALVQRFRLEKDPRLKLQTVRALGGISSPNAQKRLRTWALESQNPRIRAEALNALSQDLKEPRNLRALQEAASRDPDPKIRAFAQRVLRSRKK